MASPARAPSALVIPRYMARFSCIGGDCEETCCSGWAIPIDRANYQALRKAMNRAPREREEFRRALRRNESPDANRFKYALMVLREDGRCPFLDQDKLCSLHKRYGQRRLSDTCAMFPRGVGEAGSRLELSGSLACPEVARQLLLQDDAMMLEDAAPADFPREMREQVLPEEGTDGYRRAFDEVRLALVTVLASDEAPLSSRLALAVAAAQDTAATFRPGVGNGDLHRVVAKLAELRAPGVVRVFQREFNRFEPPAGLGVSTLGKMLALHVRDAPVAFRRLFAPLLPPLCRDDLLAGDHAIDFAAVHSDHAARREFWQARHRQRIDGYFRNYCLHFIFRHWYVSYPDLAVYLARLLARVALLRVALLGHPLVTQAMNDDDPSRREAALDRAVVEAVYRLTRQIEHTPSFQKALEREIDPVASSFPLAMCLAKL